VFDLHLDADTVESMTLERLFLYIKMASDLRKEQRKAQR
jgi:hypothetical protein